MTTPALESYITYHWKTSCHLSPKERDHVVDNNLVLWCPTCCCSLRFKLTVRRRGAQGCECGCGHHQDKAYHGYFEDGVATSCYPRVTSWIYFAVDQGQVLSNACLFFQHMELCHRDDWSVAWWYSHAVVKDSWYQLIRHPFHKYSAIHVVSWGNDVNDHGGETQAAKTFKD